MSFQTEIAVDSEIVLKPKKQLNRANKIQKLTLSRFDSNSWLHVGWKGIRLDVLPAEICKWDLNDIVPAWGINFGILGKLQQGIR